MSYLIDLSRIELTSFIAESTDELFDFTFLDTSAITVRDFSDSFTSYAVDSVKTRIVPNQGFESNEVFKLQYVQSRVQNKTTWSV